LSEAWREDGGEDDEQLLPLLLGLLVAAGIASYA
jgi:hypothetical protein